MQRWEKREGMPVHRHPLDKIGSVYASRSELDAWAASRNPKGTEIVSRATSFSAVTPPEPVPTPHLKKRAVLPARAITVAALGLTLVLAATLLVRGTDFFWCNPIQGAVFQPTTDFDGVARNATLSRDGYLVAFLSDHDGQMDVWVSQIGSGQFTT